MTMTTTPTPKLTTWKPMIAGILTVIAGVVTIVAEMIYMTSGTFGIFGGVPFIESSANPNGALFITGAVATVGGILALLRRVWWLALVGTIFSMLFTIWPVLVIGMISIILLATSRLEFKRAKST